LEPEPASAAVRRSWWPVVSLTLAIAGVAVATYLTVIHYRDDLLVCGVGNCQTVQNSRYAEIGGVPISILGLGMYLGVLSLGLARWRRPAVGETATLAAFALVLAGALYAGYLTYVEIAVINAICQWCVVSALLTLGILVAEGRGVAGVLAAAE
jgi:uncharacterized membrane protein